MAIHSPCGSTWSGRTAEHCPACCITFSSASAGDRHRTGSFEDGTRRCRRPEELNLVLLNRGGPVWGYPPMPEEVLARRKGLVPSIISIEELLEEV